MVVDLGSMKVVLKAQDDMSKTLGKAKTNVSKFSGAITKMGLASTLGYAALAAAAYKGIKTVISWNMEFERSLANVSTMLEEGTMVYMAEYEQGLMDLARAYGESTDTLAKGLYDILSAGIDASEAMNVLTVSAQAAQAGLTDTGVAADAITTILNSYSDSGFQASQVSDMLFAIVKRGKTTFGELAPAIGKSATLASQAGISFQELGAMISTLTRAGIDTNEAMTAVNGVIRAFLKPTEEAVDLAKEFGIEMGTTEIRGLGLLHIMRLMKGANEEQLASMFPNIRGLKGLQGVLGDLDGAYSDLNLIMTSEGLTAEALGKQTNTLWMETKRLGQTVKTEVTEYFKEDVGVLKSVVGQMNILSGSTDAMIETDDELNHQIKILNEEYANFAELQKDQIPLVDEYREKFEALNETMSEQKTKIQEAKDALNDYLDVTRMEGYEETTDEMRKKKMEMVGVEKQLNALELAGQKDQIITDEEGNSHTELTNDYRLQKEELERLRLEYDAQRLNLDELRLKNEELIDVSSDIIDKNIENEEGFETLRSKVVENSDAQVDWQDKLTDTQKKYAETRKSLEEDIIKPLDDYRTLLDELTSKIHTIKINIQETKGGAPAAEEGGPSFLETIGRRGGQISALGGGGGVGGAIGGAIGKTINQAITIITPYLDETPDEILATTKRAG